jgi:hypothetical protein
MKATSGPDLFDIPKLPSQVLRPTDDLSTPLLVHKDAKLFSNEFLHFNGSSDPVGLNQFPALLVVGQFVE